MATSQQDLETFRQKVVDFVKHCKTIHSSDASQQELNSIDEAIKSPNISQQELSECLKSLEKYVARPDVSKQDLDRLNEALKSFENPIMRHLLFGLVDESDSVCKEDIRNEINRRFPEVEIGFLKITMDDGKVAGVMFDSCDTTYNFAEEFRKLILSGNKKNQLLLEIIKIIKAVEVRYQEFMNGDDPLSDKIAELVDFPVTELVMDRPTFTMRLGKSRVGIKVVIDN